MAKIATIGLWHLGCVVSAGLASLGHTVRGTDPQRETVRNLQRAMLPIHEPGLLEFMTTQSRQGRLLFVDTSREALEGAEFIYVTFDTPVDDHDCSDLNPLVAALEEIAQHGAPTATIVIMSQVPVGTCDVFAEQLRRLAPKASFRLVCQPENLRLGKALETFLQPDFLLVGAQEESAANDVLALYGSLQVPKLMTSRNSAEMTKHMLNAFLATSVSFANEIADLAEVCDADIRDVVRVLRLDRRIGEHAFLNPGPGFSGGTLGRDVQTLRHLGASEHRPTPHLDATMKVNESRMSGLLAKLEREYGSLSGLRVGLLGLTYKPGTSTLRRSRALELAALLLSKGVSVRAFDPMVHTATDKTGAMLLCADAYRAADGADAVIVMTAWPEFQNLDLPRLKRSMRRPLLLDIQNSMDARAVRAAGLRYSGVGVAEHAAMPVAVASGARS